MNVYRKIQIVFGSYAELADQLGLSRAAVSNWSRRGRIPARHCILIRDLSDNQITLHDLNPDIYPEPDPQ